MPTGIYKRPSIKERLFKSFKINKKTGCWEWQLSINTFGYGQIRVNNPRSMRKPHRIMYELMKGKIPKKLSLDHLCRNRACINPDHLEVVTNKENILRGVGITAQNAKKTHCKRGHRLSGKNLFFYKKANQRMCRTCNYIRNKKFKDKIKFSPKS